MPCMVIQTELAARDISLCPLNTTMLGDIVGHQEAKETHAVYVLKAETLSQSQDVPPQRLSSVHMETHTKISSRLMALSPDDETQALHVAGQCALSVTEFICTVTNCFAERR